MASKNYKGVLSGGRHRLLNSLNSISKRAYRWARSLFCPVNLEITTEKWKTMRRRKKKEINTTADK